jgi:hypothetical protein
VYHERFPSLLALTALGCLCGSACASAAPPADAPSIKPDKPAPLVRVRVQSRLRRSIRVGERIQTFDRLSFSAPAAALYDEKRDVYWVSNGNGSAKDKGFISRLGPEGDVMTLNYIDGARSNVTLHSPAGMAMRGDHLLVADVDVVREFNADTGEPLGRIEVPGARYLNDVAVAPDGSLYVVDLGAAPEFAGAGNGADAAYRITPSGELVPLLKGTAFAGPSALLAEAEGVAMAALSGELILFSSAKPQAKPSRDALGLGPLRGVVRLDGGTLLVSAWEAGAVYGGAPGDAFEPVLDGLETPADIGYDVKRKRVLIPLLTGDALAVYEVAAATPRSKEKNDQDSGTGSAKPASGQPAAPKPGQSSRPQSPKTPPQSRTGGTSSKSS